MQSNPSRYTNPQAASAAAGALHRWCWILRCCLIGIAVWLPAGCAPDAPSLSSPPAALPPNRDGAPVNPPDLSAVPDAVPRVEAPSKWGNPESYEVFGQSYHTLPSSLGYTAEGVASWYGTAFHGKRTSSGEPYDMYAMTAAHRSLPLPTYLEVTNLDNQRRVVVRVNDRGPFHPDRILDLSYAAATRLGIAATGTGRVRLRALQTDAVGSATAPVPTPRPVSTSKQDAVSSGRVYLQLGAFTERGNAEQLRDRLLRAKLRTPPIEVADSPGQTLYRLRLGPLHGVDEVEDLRTSLRALGVTDAYVIRE